MLDSPGYAASLPRFVKTFDEPLWLVLLGQENPTLSLFHRISSAAGKQSPNASGGTRPRGRHGTLKTSHCIGPEWLLMAPTTGICAFVVGNLNPHSNPAR